MECMIDSLTNTSAEREREREAMCIVDLADELDNRSFARKREREKYDDRLAIAARFVQLFSSSFLLSLSLVRTHEAREREGERRRKMLVVCVNELIRSVHRESAKYLVQSSGLLLSRDFDITDCVYKRVVTNDKRFAFSQNCCENSHVQQIDDDDGRATTRPCTIFPPRVARLHALYLIRQMRTRVEQIATFAARPSLDGSP